MPSAFAAAVAALANTPGPLVSFGGWHWSGWGSGSLRRWSSRRLRKAVDAAFHKVSAAKKNPWSHSHLNTFDSTPLTHIRLQCNRQGSGS